jgi:hypothetical protein
MPLTKAELGLACLRGFLRVGVTGLLDTTSSEFTLRGVATVPASLDFQEPEDSSAPTTRPASPTAKSWRSRGKT